MIKGLEFENARIFEGSGWNFPLSSLTVFCGTNSTGKSTLLKVLLLLRQSMGIKESFDEEEGKLRFVGSQVDLGSYYSFVSHNDIQHDLSIVLTTESNMPLATAHELRSQKAPSDKTATDTFEGIVPYSLRASYRFGVIFEEKDPLDSSVFSFTENIQEALTPSPKGFLKRAVYDLSVDGEELLSWSVVHSGQDEDGDPEYEILIPQDYFDSIERLSKIKVDRDSGKGYAKVRVILRGLIPTIMVAQLLPKSDDSLEEQEQLIGLPLPVVIYNVSKQFRQTITGIDYIGPLRSPVKRYYLVQPDVSPPLDPAGEFLPYILRNIGRYEAWHIPPGLGIEPRSVPLFNSLNSWMYYIRTGQKPPEEVYDKEIDWDINQVLVEIKIKSVIGDEMHALTDSGFGYSQVLPIIIRGLLAAKGNILIVEQPELHLNPAIQVRVAKFFVAMAKAGKQVLIETHSEHIVNTIRVLAAEDESGELASMCGVFYIDIESEQPVVHELSIKQDGTIPNWPRQFFGEAASLTGRLLRAQKRFRKQASKE